MAVFRIALLTALATLGLGAGFLFAGSFMVKQWGLDCPPAADVLSRRIGAVYLGLSLLRFLIHADPAATAVTAASSGAALIAGLLAGTGAYAMVTKRVSTGTRFAIGVEVLLTLGFLSTFWPQPLAPTSGPERCAPAAA